MASESPVQKGIVIKSTGSWYTVRTDNGGPLVDCKVKGNFRLKGIRSTNPVAV
ncbi:MAG: ribosome small subunit-dependent GTPase A, partial [Bacteroidaceae bacterium]|nr:ribosome small subunit-dependent GTPase A [Bacteroidaceae bacterium]